MKVFYRAKPPDFDNATSRLGTTKCSSYWLYECYEIVFYSIEVRQNIF